MNSTGLSLRQPFIACKGVLLAWFTMYREGDRNLMTPTEFATGLANVMGVGRTEIATVDRALAKRGLRQIARGHHHPDVILKECEQLVYAWTGTGNLTIAAEEVKRLERFVPNVTPPDE